MSSFMQGFARNLVGGIQLGERQAEADMRRQILRQQMEDAAKERRLQEEAAAAYRARMGEGAAPGSGLSMQPPMMDAAPTTTGPVTPPAATAPAPSYAPPPAAPGAPTPGVVSTPVTPRPPMGGLSPTPPAAPVASTAPTPATPTPVPGVGPAPGAAPKLTSETVKSDKPAKAAKPEPSPEQVEAKALSTGLRALPKAMREAPAHTQRAALHAQAQVFFRAGKVEQGMRLIDAGDSIFDANMKRVSTDMMRAVELKDFDTAIKLYTENVPNGVRVTSWRRNPQGMLDLTIMDPAGKESSITMSPDQLRETARALVDPANMPALREAALKAEGERFRTGVGAALTGNVEFAERVLGAKVKVRPVVRGNGVADQIVEIEGREPFYASAYNGISMADLQEKGSKLANTQSQIDERTSKAALDREDQKRKNADSASLRKYREGLLANDGARLADSRASAAASKGETRKPWDSAAGIKKIGEALDAMGEEIPPNKRQQVVSTTNAVMAAMSRQRDGRDPAQDPDLAVVLRAALKGNVEFNQKNGKYMIFDEEGGRQYTVAGFGGGLPYAPPPPPAPGPTIGQAMAPVVDAIGDAYADEETGLRMRPRDGYNPERPVGTHGY